MCFSKVRQEVLYNITPRAKHLSVKGLTDIKCHALEAVPELRAIHKLNAYFILQKIKSECKYSKQNYSATIVLADMHYANSGIVNSSS